MFKNLLLAVDILEPEGAKRAARAAVSMARAEGASLHVLNVVPDTGMAIVGASLSAEQLAHARAEATKELETWAASTIPGDIQYTCHVAQGTVYDQIIQLSNKLGVDAIVVGAHRPELKDYLLGTNAARVVRHAPQSVFVVR